MSILDELFNLGNGIRSGIEDAPAFVEDVFTGVGVRRRKVQAEAMVYRFAIAASKEGNSTICT